MLAEAEPPASSDGALQPSSAALEASSAALRPQSPVRETSAQAGAAAPDDAGSICQTHLKKMESQGYWCPEELRTLPEDYGTASMYNEHRYLPEDYSETDAKQKALSKRQGQEGTIWSSEFNHSSALTVGDVQKQLPKPDKLKDLVKYKGPFKKDQVLKQATVNAELQKAIESGDSDMVAALLRFGLMKRCVNVNAPLWPKRERMLHLAARRDQRDICIMLLEAKAELDCEEITDGRHPLHDACSAGAYDVVELLLDKKARVEENTFTGMRPLHWAASKGHKDVVDLLLDRKASIHSTSSDTKEALHHAATSGHAEVVRLLCKRGSKINSETNSFHRPIHMACANGHLKAAAVLMDFGSLGVMDDKGALQKYQGTPIEEFMRVVEQLRFQRDEAEELYDMGQEDEAYEAFKQLIEGYPPAIEPRGCAASVFSMAPLGKASRAEAIWREAWVGSPHLGVIELESDTANGQEKLIIRCKSIFRSHGAEAEVLDDGRTVGVGIGDTVSFGIVERKGKPPVAVNIFRAPEQKKKKRKALEMEEDEDDDLPPDLQGELGGVIRNQSGKTGDYWVECYKVFDAYQRDAKIFKDELPDDLKVGDSIYFRVKPPSKDMSLPLAKAVRKAPAAVGKEVWQKSRGKGKGKGRPPIQRTGATMRMVGIVKRPSETTGRTFIFCQDISDVYGKDAQIPEEEMPAEGLTPGDRIAFDVDEPDETRVHITPWAFNIKVLGGSSGKKKVIADMGDGEEEGELLAEIEEVDEPEAKEEPLLDAAEDEEALAFAEEEDPSYRKPAVRRRKVSAEEEEAEPTTTEGWVKAQARLFPGESKLPKDWIRIRSKSKGLVYFYNVATGQSTPTEPKK